MKKIIIFTAVFAMVFGGTALAADWNFYGSSRMALYSNSWSKDYAAANLGGWTSGADYTTTTFAQQGNSRIGANVAAGDVSGRFEYGTGVNVRLLYGSWNFGGGTMSVGQMYNPTYYGLSNSVYMSDNNLGGFGAPFTRKPQIEFKFGNFKIAAVTPNATTAGVYSVARGTIPKLEAAYNAPMGPVKLHVSAGYNTWDAVDPATDDSISVTSYVAQIMAKYNAGPLMVGGSFAYGVNAGNYGMNLTDSTADAAVITGTKVEDTTSMGVTLVLGFAVSDMVGIEGGVGYAVSSYDDSALEDDTAIDYYLQVPLTLADGVFIIPEIGMLDYAEDSGKNKEGDITYFGAKFQINF